VFFVLTLLIAIVSTTAASAEDQDSVPGPSPAVDQSTGNPDFLFGSPRGSVGLRGSWLFARAGSDLFDFVEQTLTIDRKDFNVPTFAVDLAVAVTPRIDAVFGVDVSQASIGSEYRHFVDNNRDPITQETRLREVSLTGSIRVAMTPRGRAISRFAWIPSRISPYVGAGGGAVWYQFKQSGDFVDAFAPPPQPIFSDVFTSQGWTPSAHAFGGVDIKLSRIWFLVVDGRYLWAHAKLGRDFQNFDPIDLAGLRLSAGVNVLF
jgi:hypothetical protein